MQMRQFLPGVKGQTPMDGAFCVLQIPPKTAGNDAPVCQWTLIIVPTPVVGEDFQQQRHVQRGRR